MKKEALPRRKRYYLGLRKDGWAIRPAAAEANISPTTAYKVERERGLVMEGGDTAPDPKTLEELSPEARRGVDDFLYFATHFLEDPEDEERCLSAPPFWAELANLISDPYPHDIITIHPGAGKSTAILAYISWRVTKARALGDKAFSTIYGSGNTSLAEDAVRMITNWFYSDRLIQAYGRYKPESDDETEKTWSKEKLVVAGMGKGKAATLSIFSVTGRIRGIRVKLNIWDDPQDEESSTIEGTDKVLKKWDGSIEDRTEPNIGKTVVVGTYASPYDLQHILLGRTWTDEDGVEHKIWRQTLFPAHDDTKCGGVRNHGQYPEGCLLWPERWPYEELLKKQANEYVWKLQWQLQDVPEGELLVPQIWIDGGQQGSHVYPGCLDRDREMWELPTRGGVLIGSLDPSPTQWSAFELWLYQEPYDYLIAFERLRLRGDDEYLEQIRSWTSKARELMEFDTWIIERTGNRYLLDSLYKKKIHEQLGISIIEHETAGNKNDKESGVWAIRDSFKYGRKRLPYASGPTQAAMRHFINEHVRYPAHPTYDSVMADWFYERWKRAVVPPTQRNHLPKRQVPSWFANWMPARTGVRV